MYHGGKSTTEINAPVIIKRKPTKYDYPFNIIINGIKKALQIPQNELRKPKEKQIYQVLPSTFNSNNISVYNVIKNFVEVLKRNNVPGFESVKLTNSKRQPPDLKKLLTKVEFSNKKVAFKKCQDSRCECCKSLLLSKKYTFENVNKTFALKTPMSCNSFNVIYVVIC